MQEFYAGQTVFLTGATGFLGKLLMEKLLRSCDVKKIYILMRMKKGKSETERFAEIFEQLCFKPLREQNPNFASKVSLMNGNLTEPDLGLSDESKRTIIEEVNTIFHVAATVRFDQHLKSATYINVRSVRDLVRIAKEMKRLKSFVHVSTAYSHCVRTDIGESFYDTPLSGESLIKVMECLDDDTISKITPTLLGDWPNSYVLTKAVGENVLKAEGKGLPVSMVRPAIVTTSAKEPMPGWIDNIYGVNGVAAGVGLGIIRTMPGNTEINAEIVPVDFVINNILCAAWNRAEENRSKAIDTEGEDIPVYNYVYSTFKHLNWGKFFDDCSRLAELNPPEKAIWYMCFAFRPHPLHHELAIFFLHTVPAYVIDMVLFCMGKKPMAVESYKKIRKYLDVIAYFAQKNWNFRSDNVFKLRKSLSERDRELFDFDIGGVEWEQFITDGILGGRTYLLKESLDTLPQARRKMRLLKVAHYALCTVLLYLLFKMALFFYGVLFDFVF